MCVCVCVRACVRACECECILQLFPRKAWITKDVGESGKTRAQELRDEYRIQHNAIPVILSYHSTRGLHQASSQFCLFSSLCVYVRSCLCFSQHIMQSGLLANLQLYTHLMFLMHPAPCCLLAINVVFMYLCFPKQLQSCVCDEGAFIC